MVQSQLLLWAVVFVGILGFGIFGVVAPLMKKYAVTQIRLKGIKAKVEYTERASRDLNNLDSSLKQTREELEYLKQMTLKPGEQAKVISLITQATQKLNIAILNIKPVPLPPPTPVNSEGGKSEKKKIKPILFYAEMDAPYPSLGDLFAELSNASLLLTIEEFQMTPIQANPGILRTQATLAVYEETV